MRKNILLLLLLTYCCFCQASVTYKGTAYLNDNIMCVMQCVSSNKGSDLEWILILMDTSMEQYPPNSQLLVGENVVNAHLIGKKIIMWCWRNKKRVMDICNQTYSVPNGRVFLISQMGNIGQVKDVDDCFKTHFKEESKVNDSGYAELDNGKEFILNVVRDLSRKNIRISNFIKDSNSLEINDPQFNVSEKENKAVEEYIRRLKNNRKNLHKTDELKK